MISYPTWVIVTLAVLVPPIFTAVTACWLAKILPHCVALLTGLIAPSVIVVWTYLSPDTRPTPLSVDGPPYVLIALSMLAAIELPLCLGAAWGGVRWRRRSTRDGRT